MFVIKKKKKTQQNRIKTRYDLHVVHKVPSELVQLEQKLVISLPLANMYKQETTQIWFPQFQITQCQVSFKCLYYEQQRGKYNNKNDCTALGRVK